jgi:predicted N-acetyltransferase YhbS
MNMTIGHESGSDVAAREALLDEAYGLSRFRKPSEKMRHGRQPAEGLSLVAADGDRVVGTVRLWHVSCGDKPALLLGPLAVACDRQGQGIGAALVARALEAARADGHGAIVLVGDAAYYGRFGFTAAKTGALAMPGPFERHRLLGLELVPGALDGAAGIIAATGRPVTKTRRKAA